MPEKIEGHNVIDPALVQLLLPAKMDGNVRQVCGALEVNRELGMRVTLIRKSTTVGSAASLFCGGRIVKSAPIGSAFSTFTK